MLDEDAEDAEDAEVDVALEVELAAEVGETVVAPDPQPASDALNSRAATPVAGTSRVDFVIAVKPLRRPPGTDVTLHYRSMGSQWTT